MKNTTKRIMMVTNRHHNPHNSRYQNAAINQRKICYSMEEAREFKKEIEALGFKITHAYEC